MELNPSERRERARELFKGGCNCAQAVLMTYSDLINVDPTTLSAISAPFGGGLGRMREVCGAVSGMAMVCGVLNPTPDAKNQVAKLTKELCEEFRAQNGSIVCRELLGNNKRPCAELVEQAVEILANRL